MSRLTVTPDDRPGQPELRTEDPAVIGATLAPLGVRFERWPSPRAIAPDEPAEAILAAFRPHLDALLAGAAGTADVIRLRGATDAYPAMRRKFLDEHTHTEDEVRFFVHGSGNFVLHIGNKVYDAQCTAGDLISVPTGTKHWFDAGPEPYCTVLRIFTDTSGWTPHYTGDRIAERFPVA